MSGSLPPIPPGFKLEAQGGPEGMPAPPGQGGLPPIPSGWQLDTSATTPQPVDYSLSTFLKRPSVANVILNTAAEYGSGVGEHFMSGFTRMGQGLHEAIDTPAGSLKDVGHTPILEADYPVSEAYLKFLAKAQATPNKFAPAPAAVKP